MALKYPDDTNFYCFRAIEALKHYCKNGFDIDDEPDQWKKVSEITGYKRDYIEFIRKHAFPERHGDISVISGNERQKVLSKTWDVVESFIEKV